jgi:hypothetical protein
MNTAASSKLPAEPHIDTRGAIGNRDGRGDRLLRDPTPCRSAGGPCPPPFSASGAAALALPPSEILPLHVSPPAAAVAACGEGAALELIREQLECILCFQGFCADGPRTPKQLPCGHSLCLTCLTALLLSTRRLCPTCGDSQGALPDRPAEEYPYNWDLRAVARALEGGSSGADGGCGVGGDNMGGLECADCAAPAASATHACRTCVAALCRAHAAAHARGRTTAAHGPPVTLTALLADLGVAGVADLCAAHLLARPCPQCAAGPAAALRASMEEDRAEQGPGRTGVVATPGQEAAAPAGSGDAKRTETRGTGAGDSPSLHPAGAKAAVGPAAQRLASALAKLPRRMHPALVRPRAAPVSTGAPAAAPLLHHGDGSR